MLGGLMPVTRQIAELSPEGIDVQPTEEVINYYCANGSRFLMVSVVANCCVFRKEDSLIRGYPYSVSLFPASKRDELDYVDVRFAASFDLESMPTRDCIYLNYDPFCGDWGLFGPYGLLAGKDGVNLCFTDMIGFVMGTYFLADCFNREDILLPNMADAPHTIQKKYRNIRIKRYFSPFNDLRPRRIWGVDSPIELFLMQGLVARGLFPIPQYLIYEDGRAYPSLHDILLDDSFDADQSLITEADFCFPKNRLAIFCDSGKYHRGRKAQQKDKKITEALEKLGYSVLRIPGSSIAVDVNAAVDLVAEKLG